MSVERMIDTSPRVYTSTQLALILGCSRRQVQQLAQAKYEGDESALPVTPLRIGKDWRFCKKEVDERFPPT